MKEFILKLIKMDWVNNNLDGENLFNTIIDSMPIYIFIIYKIKKILK